mmetsp:Transcript_42885/g.105327  ORF Transcript_42885/g.105327 Transcript_42885/m.105327 type:complete len:253 (+) Transcript_42885:30-788(+)
MLAKGSWGPWGGGSEFCRQAGAGSGLVSNGNVCLEQKGVEAAKSCVVRADLGVVGRHGPELVICHFVERTNVPVGGPHECHFGRVYGLDGRLGDKIAEAQVAGCALLEHAGGQHHVAGPADCVLVYAVWGCGDQKLHGAVVEENAGSAVGKDGVLDAAGNAGAVPGATRNAKEVAAPLGLVVGVVPQVLDDECELVEKDVGVVVDHKVKAGVGVGVVECEESRDVLVLVAAPAAAEDVAGEGGVWAEVEAVR